MIFIQIAEEISKQVFTISPSSIYAFLVGVLIIGNAAQSTAIIYLYKQNNKLITFIAEEMANTASAITRLIDRKIK